MFLLGDRAQLDIQPCGRKTKIKKHGLTFGTWNVRTLLDNESREERRTALIGRTLRKYHVDIAALSETRLAEESSMEEVGAGYTYFWKGKPDGAPRTGGVGFAIRTSLTRDLESLPRGVSDRIMVLRLKLNQDCYATIVSVYAPTMTHTDESKDAFYEELDRVLQGIRLKDKLIVLGDFNARVGADHDLWPRTLGKHGIGKCNSNGELLLSACAAHDLLITNTAFQQAAKHKTTWMHPRSKHWHMLDYVIVRRRDRRDVNITRALRGSGWLSDHLLVRSIMKLQVTLPERRQRQPQTRKLNVKALADADKIKELGEGLKSHITINCDTAGDNPEEATDIENLWKSFRDSTLNVATDVLGFVKRKHQDWFDENDEEIEPLLSAMHAAHRDFIGSKQSPALKKTYLECKRAAQKRLRQMKNKWWEDKAAELQEAADTHNTKALFDGLKAVYGPRSNGSAPILSADNSTLLLDKSEILSRWAEHFNALLNKQSVVSEEALRDTPQLPTLEQLDLPPNCAEVTKAIKQQSSGKAAGPDGIPPEVYKCGGAHMASALTKLFRAFWTKGDVPQELKDASIIHLYKRKGNRSQCDNHRGISLLSIAGKILARVILNRLTTEVIGKVYPESQCGFRSGRGTADMVFAYRQLQEKCIEQNQPLYTVFVDLTKAFDTVSRDGLWKLLHKIGCPERIITIIRAFHDGMKGRVFDNGNFSEPFSISNGAKQGCVLAPTLFGIVFALMLQYAFRELDLGVYLQVRCDGGVFNLRRFLARTKITEFLIRDLLYADDCALSAHSLEDIQAIVDRFSDAAKKFGLTISIKKTELMYQPRPNEDHYDPVVTIDDTELASVKNFCYLGSVMSFNGSLDDEITQRISKASVAFGRLTHRLWKSHDVKLRTKIGVYRAAVLSSLLYCCETWTPYRRHIRKLEAFHMRCLRRICNIRWQDRVPNTDVLEKCGLTSIEALLVNSQLRWAGHVVRMSDERIPKALLYGQLKGCTRRVGRPRLRYKDTLKHNLKTSKLNTNTWEAEATNRSAWRNLCRVAVGEFEKSRIAAAKEKRAARKSRVPPPNAVFACSKCDKLCLSRIGLLSHERAHARRDACPS